MWMLLEDISNIHGRKSPTAKNIRMVNCDNADVCCLETVETKSFNLGLSIKIAKLRQIGT